jgi:hypothetical protein
LAEVLKLPAPEEISAENYNPRSFEALAEEIRETRAGTDFAAMPLTKRMGLAEVKCRKRHPPTKAAVPLVLGFVLLAGGLSLINNARTSARRREKEDIIGGRRVSRSREAHPSPQEERDESSGRRAVEIDVGDLQLDLGGSASEVDSSEEGDTNYLMQYVPPEKSFELGAGASDGEGFVPSARADEDAIHELSEVDEEWFTPPRYVGKPALFVDPKNKAAQDALALDDYLSNAEQPYKTLEAALKAAKKLAASRDSLVQVRVRPGVYETSIEIPDRVAVINDRLAAVDDNKTRLAKLLQAAREEGNAVVIRPPKDAKYAVKFARGSDQALYGCLLISKEGSSQAGAIASGSKALTIANCVIEGFQNHAIRLDNCGSETPSTATVITACGIRRNQAPHGGALWADTSALEISDSIFRENGATKGGALHLESMKGTVSIQACRFSANRARPKNLPRFDPDGINLPEWRRMEGLGGAIFASESKLRIAGVEFVDNGAAVAGGAAAFLACKTLLTEHEELPTRFGGNKGRVGGGVFAAGWPPTRSTLKAQKVVFEGNTGALAGGGLSVLGLLTAQLENCKVVGNDVQEGGAGGGISCHLGAELIAQETLFTENKTHGNGGAIGALNATVRLGDDCRIHKNGAKKDGGGIWMISAPSTVVDGMLTAKQIPAPFVLALGNVIVENNIAKGRGGGLRAGNTMPAKTFAIGMKFERPERIRDNRAPEEDAADVWIVWADKTVHDGSNRPSNKVVLK